MTAAFHFPNKPYFCFVTRKADEAKENNVSGVLCLKVARKNWDTRHIPCCPGLQTSVQNYSCRVSLCVG